MRRQVCGLDDACRGGEERDLQNHANRSEFHKQCVSSSLSSDNTDSNESNLAHLSISPV